MAIRDQVIRHGRRRLLRRATRAVPFLGTLVAIATVGAMIRRKGLGGGVLDSVLNAIPFVGGLKIAAEVVRGRDFIPASADATGQRAKR